jgi:hypothetical protein
MEVEQVKDKIAAVFPQEQADVLTAVMLEIISQFKRGGDGSIEVDQMRDRFAAVFPEEQADVLTAAILETIRQRQSDLARARGEKSR